MEITYNKVAVMLLIALLGGTLAACAAQLTAPPQEQDEFQAVSNGQQPWPSIEELLAKIPPDELKQLVEEPFRLIGPGDQVIIIPRPPMDKETALRLWWEASRRTWAKISERFRAMLAGKQDHRFLNDPSFKARMQEENHQILADELRQVLAEWEQAKSRSP